MKLRLLRPDDIYRRGGFRHSWLYAAIDAGLWPPLIKHGRCSVQPEHEVDAMLAAIVAGATADEKRKLVKQLVAQRKAETTTAVCV
jgi:hypothetical protein